MKEKFRLKEFAEKHGLTMGKKSCYGNYRGYRIHVKYAAMGNPACLITVVTNTKGREQEIEKYLQKNKRELKLTNYGVVGIGLMVSPQLYMKIFEQIEKILDKITGYLHKAGFSGAEICPYCGMPMENGGIEMVESGIPFRAHEECFEAALEVARRREEEELQKPSKRAVGFAGACLGALAGAALFILMYLWWNFAALGVVAGVLLAGYLYGRMGGKSTKFKVVCSSLVPLIVTLLVYLGCLLIQAGLSDAGTNLWNKIMTDFANDSEYRLQVLLNIIFIFLLDFMSTVYILFSYLRTRRRISANMFRSEEKM